MKNKKKKAKKNNMDNFFNEMGYELAGDIGAIGNEEMVNSNGLTTGQSSHNKNQAARKKH